MEKTKKPEFASKTRNSDVSVSVGKIEWKISLFNAEKDKWERKRQIILLEGSKLPEKAGNLLFSEKGNALVSKPEKKPELNPKDLDILKISRIVGKGIKRRIVTEKVVKSAFLNTKEQLKATDSTLWHPRLSELIIGTPKSLKRKISLKTQTKHLNHLPKVAYANYLNAQVINGCFKLYKRIKREKSSKMSPAKEKELLANLRIEGTPELKPTNQWKSVWASKSKKTSKMSIRRWIDSNINRNPSARAQLESEFENMVGNGFIRLGSPKQTQKRHRSPKRGRLQEIRLKDGSFFYAPFKNRSRSKQWLTKEENELLGNLPA